MGKGKKKGTKKAGMEEGFFNTAVDSLRQYRRITKEIGKMSAGQKVVGGLLLLAAGYAYLTSQASDKPAKAKPSTAPPPAEADETGPEPAEASLPVRRRKKAHHHDL